MKDYSGFYALGICAFLLLLGGLVSNYHYKNTQIIPSATQSTNFPQVDFDSSINFGYFSTNVLTFTNRPYLSWGDYAILIRLTEEEWDLLTNAFPEKIKTDALTISKSLLYDKDE